VLDLAPFTRLDGWISLLTLTALEVVLGIDNIVFLSIMTGSSRPNGSRWRAVWDWASPW